MPRKQMLRDYHLRRESGCERSVSHVDALLGRRLTPIQTTQTRASPPMMGMYASDPTVPRRPTSVAMMDLHAMVLA